MIAAYVMQLDGKRIILTGGSGGIGTPLVQLLLGRRGTVSVIGRSPIHVQGVAHIAADLATDDGISRASAEIARLDPDILIHLAGSQYFGPFAEQSGQDILNGYRINLLAPAVLTRAAVPGMRGRGGGHVLFAGSVFGAIPFAHFAAYSSAKAGVAALCDALRREFDGSGITFTCAVPRAVKTPMATEKIRKFAEIAGFKFDEPGGVAGRILDVVLRGGGEMGPGFPESLFMRLSALFPALISRGLAENDRKARALFISNDNTSRD
jgi:short-subunit dehydrogenase